MAGNIEWYQNDEEIKTIALGPINLMVEFTGWRDNTFMQPDRSESHTYSPKAASFHHAKITWKWTGEESLTDVNYVLVPSKNYSGQSDADADVDELKEWAISDGTYEYGYNSYPTACQRYNVCVIVEDSSTQGWHVESMDDNAGGMQECVNLNEGAHNRCLPCIGAAGNVDNLNLDWDAYWADNDKTKMITMPGGLVISQGSGSPTLESWEWFNSGSSRPYTVPHTEGTVSPNEEQTVYLKVCIPWGCFCGGRRSIGFGIDYIYTM